MLGHGESEGLGGAGSKEEGAIVLEQEGSEGWRG